MKDVFLSGFIQNHKNHVNISIYLIDGRFHSLSSFFELLRAISWQALSIVPTG